MYKENEKYYKYTRGDKYMLVCVVDEHGFIDYVQEQLPHNPDPDVVLRFYEDAEKAIMQLHYKEKS